MAGRSLYALAIIVVAALLAVILDGVVTCIAITASSADASPLSWLDLTSIGLPAIAVLGVIAAVSSYASYLRVRSLTEAARRFVAVTFLVAFMSLALAGADIAMR